MVHVLEIIGKRPVGGVGTVMLNYQKFIDAGNVRMDYLIFGEERETFDEQVRKLGSKVYVYPELSASHMGRTRRYIDEFLREHRGEYDIVHLHAPSIAFLVFPIVEKYGIRHRIVHSHATLYAENKIKAVRNRILWNMSKGTITDRIGCSDAAGRFLFRDEPYIVLKNAIDKQEYYYDEELRNKVRSRELADREALVVGNVGRFSQQKNQTYLIELFAEVKRREPRAVLWLVGDGNLRQQIEEKIREKGLAVWTWDGQQKPEHYDVKMFGMVNNVKELYQAMDVMAMPSLFEGLPMVGVEAQASGLPCVFSDAVTREVDIADAVYLPLSADPRKWAEAMIAAGHRDFRRSFDTELDELGFNIRLEAKRLQELYLKIAGE